MQKNDTLKWLISTILQAVVVSFGVWSGMRLYVDKAVEAQDKMCQLRLKAHENLSNHPFNKF